MITPAVTVLGAIEGLSLVTPAFESLVVPLAIVALLWLFGLQKRGTGAIGRLFGPLMIVWFLILATLGVVSIVANPMVLTAINPMHALAFFSEHGVVAFAVFGAVFLTVTGGEALYADLGHFGRRPIARAWFVLVWPCLLLNYFGQGALLLESPVAISNPFYLLAPTWALVPLVVLATAASIIASQAVLSGVFAITQQCQQLGYIPRMRILYSSATSIGQVYVPTVNWIICIATVALAIGFGVPHTMRGGRVQVRPIGEGIWRVTARIGFMELPDVPKLLKDAEKVEPQLRTDDAIYFLGRDDLVVGHDPRDMKRWRKMIFIFLARNALFAAAVLTFRAHESWRWAVRWKSDRKRIDFDNNRPPDHPRIQRMEPGGEPKASWHSGTFRFFPIYITMM